MPGEITPFDAAAEFGRDYESILRYLREGLVPARKDDEGHWWIDRDALAAYAQAHGWLERPYGRTGRPSKVRMAIRRLLDEANGAPQVRSLTLKYAAAVVCGDVLGHELRDGLCVRCGYEP